MIDVNYVAIVIAAVVSMALGFFWYSKSLFGKRWMKLMGYTPESLKEEQKRMGKLYAVSFVLSLVMAFVLSHVIGLALNFYTYSPLMAGVTSAFWMWIGFVLPVQTTDAIFKKGEKSWELLGINTGYQLATLLLMGIILGLFS